MSKKNKDVKEKTKKNLEDSFIPLSLGRDKDDKGLSLHTPKERYEKRLGNNPNLKKVSIKLFVIEILSLLLLSFAIVSSISSFMKDKPEHYIQPPNGIVSKIEVK